MINREMVDRAVEDIRKDLDVDIDLGLILGSGLGDLAARLEDRRVFTYHDLPGFPASSVEGHKGELVIGRLKGRWVACMNGRIHYYEGYPMEAVVFPIRVLCGLGIKKLIVTNAAGGVNPDFEPGDLMVITDQINFSGPNPLIGPNDDDLGPRFLDMSYAYSKRGRDLAFKLGQDLGLDLKEGVYMYFTGPTYETPAEVMMAGILGASAVGMSTVPEVIVANHQGVEVLGISCITNMAAGILDQPLDHEEVVRVGAEIQEDFARLVEGIVREF